MSYDFLNEDEIEFVPEPESVPSPEESGIDARSRLALQMLKQVRHSLTHVIQLLEDGDTARATRQMVNFIVDKKS